MNITNELSKRIADVLFNDEYYQACNRKLTKLTKQYITNCLLSINKTDPFQVSERTRITDYISLPRNHPQDCYI